MTGVKVERRHRERAATLIPFVASAWVEDPSHTYGLATPELSLLTKAAQAFAEAEAEHSALAAAQGEGWAPGQPLWDWDPWARFLGARAQLIHEAVAEGKSVAEIRQWLSMDEGQVRLIAATDLDTIPGIPGQVWPPARFSPPPTPEASK